MLMDMVRVTDMVYTMQRTMNIQYKHCTKECFCSINLLYSYICLQDTTLKQSLFFLIFLTGPPPGSCKASTRTRTIFLTSSFQVVVGRSTHIFTQV